MRALILAGCFATGAVVFPSLQAAAYGTDVHFNLTYVQAGLAGIAQRDALWIALADESIDHNRTTSAYSGTFDTVFQLMGVHRYVWARNGVRWQAYTDVGSSSNFLDGVVTTNQYADPARARAALIGRRDQLWKLALDELAKVQAGDRSSMIRADVALGTFLHYEQDFYGHRQFGPPLDGQNWLPYGAFRGHSAEGYSPDYVALRPQLAHEMFVNSYGYISQWQERRGNKPAQVPTNTVNAIITHMSLAYDSRATQYPAHRFRPWFPSQRSLTHELNAALASEPSTRDWSTMLPNANDLHLQLPYDQPMTPLRTVEERLNEPVLDDRRVPFARVMAGDLTSP